MVVRRHLGVISGSVFRCVIVSRCLSLHRTFLSLQLTHAFGFRLVDLVSYHQRGYGRTRLKAEATRNFENLACGTRRGQYLYFGVDSARSFNVQVSKCTGSGEWLGCITGMLCKAARYYNSRFWWKFKRYQGCCCYLVD